MERYVVKIQVISYDENKKYTGSNDVFEQVFDHIDVSEVALFLNKKPEKGN